MANTVAPTAAINSRAARSSANFTMGDMAKTSSKRRCGGCARRRAKLRKIFKRFKKGSK